MDPLQFEYPHYTPFQYAGNKPISYIDLDGLEEAKLEYNGLDYKQFRDSLRTERTRDSTLQKIIKRHSVNIAKDKTKDIIQSQLDKRAAKKLQDNIKTGRLVNNFGNTEYSWGKVKKPKDALMRGASEWKDVEYSYARGKVITRGMGHVTHDIKMLQLVSKNVGELFGPIMDLVEIGKALRNDDVPFSIVNPFSFVLDDYLNDLDQELLEMAFSEGYDSVKALMDNSRTYEEYFENKSFIYLKDEDLIKLMNGELKNADQLPDDYIFEDNPWAILIEWKDSGIDPITVYNIENK
ncbi:hypothetical protein L3073_00055 [Ancylomarina sp. DW003]|nr:hypothetical protein [Ancylomarina sp. DW003]MDE5420594.1 hypothetical protein [Ancylomarina sp. DW003]